MIRQITRGVTLRRDAYLRAVIGSNGTADAVLIIGIVSIVLAMTTSAHGVADVLGHVRFVLDDVIGWLILSGLVYAIARYGMQGEGSFQGVLAMSALAYPPLLLLAGAQLGTAIPLRLVAPPTLLILESWRFEALTAGLAVVADLWFIAILVAGTRVAMSLTIDRAILVGGAAYGSWWIVASILQF